MKTSETFVIFAHALTGRKGARVTHAGWLARWPLQHPGLFLPLLCLV